MTLGQQRTYALFASLKSSLSKSDSRDFAGWAFPSRICHHSPLDFYYERGRLKADESMMAVWQPIYFPAAQMPNLVSNEPKKEIYE